ncbi:MAG: hypothetical protein CSA95_09275 [Bacteroidetes bacterium]|nr:MAG: hypothetical protein CSA95_09275 [Bacteroidota bacterium]PIE88590.1 MAG: hypothetical protein CSA04_01110 [Bacteroidota bacterium]
MKTHLLYLLVLTSLFLGACSSGRSALKKGNYYEATLQATKRLRQAPEHEKASNVLKEAYPLAIDDLKKSIERTKASSAIQKWNTIYDYMIQANHLAHEILHCPGARKLIPTPFEYSVSTLENIKEEAVKERYQNALSLYQSGGRKNAKRAIEELEKLLEMAPQHQAAKKLLNDAEKVAMLHIVVEMLPYKHKSYELSDEAFRSNINRHIRSLDKKYKYIKVYTPEQAERLPFNPDQVITVDWKSFTVGNTRQKQIEREVTSQDSVKIGETTIEGIIYPVYDKVKAQLNINIMEIISTGTMIIEAKDFSDYHVLDSHSPSGSYTWHYEWGSFNGDERALSEEELVLCKNKPPIMPSPQFLFTELTKPLYKQTERWFDRYFRKCQ